MRHLWPRLGAHANGSVAMLRCPHVLPCSPGVVRARPAPASRGGDPAPPSSAVPASASVASRKCPTIRHLWRRFGDRMTGTWHGRGEVSCSAAARRGPQDLRTHSVPNPQGHQRILRPGCSCKPGRRKRHCCAQSAQQAEPPPSRNRSECPPGVRVACREAEHAVAACGE